MSKFIKFIAIFIFCLFCCGCNANFLKENSNFKIIKTCDESACGEVIFFEFPKWPPEKSYGKNYPEISKWLVNIETYGFSKTFCTAQNFLVVELAVNLPFSIQVSPITLLDSQKGAKKNETCFFKPAGGIYPYQWNAFEIGDKNRLSASPFCLESDILNKISGKISLSWETGFTANTMAKIFQSSKETGVTKQHICEFIQNFNWKKMQNSIEKNISKSLLDFEINEKTAKFYNPWQINQSYLLENLSFSIFDSDLLNTKNILEISVKKLDLDLGAEGVFYSSFVPENLIIERYKYFSINKNQETLFYLGNDFADLITASSIKKFLQQIIYLPIFIDDYEDNF